MNGRGTSSTPDPRWIRRVLFFLAGSLALGLGALGVVLPLLPTTPFLILAAFCYARSSRRAHSWLLSNRVFGRQLDAYLTGKGVSRWVKVGVLVFLWAVIGLSAALFAQFLWLRVLLVVIGAGVTVHVLRLKTRERQPGLDNQRMPES